MGPQKKNYKLSNAEKQCLYRERRKNNPQKEEEAKRKDRERYHLKKKLVHQLSQRDLRARRKKVKERVQRYRKNKKICIIPSEGTPISSPESTTISRPESTPISRHERTIISRPESTPISRPESTPISRPESTPISRSEITPISRQGQFGRKKMKRDRSKLYRDNKRLIKERDDALKKAEKYKKRYQRSEKNRIKALYSIPEDKMSPKSLTERTINQCLPGKLTPRKKKIARQLFIHNTTSAVMKKKYASSSKIQQQSLKRAIAPLLIKYRIANSTLASFFGIKSGIRKHVQVAKNLSAARKKEVESFFLRDDNSQATAGKKETITKNQEKRQKRFLCDSMKNLYNKYKREGGTIISYVTFASCRPFYVLIPRVKDRETCLCKLHANLQFKTDKLKNLKLINTNNMTHLAYSCVCDSRNVKCMYGECFKCKDTAVPMNSQTEFPINIGYQTSWWEWNTTTISKTEMKNSGQKIRRDVKKSIKIQKEGTIAELIRSFQQQVKLFCKHIFNIRQQFQAYKECHDNLEENEALIHIDFSENYSCKIGKEIQSFHFGGSREQVTLHTGVVYTLKNIEKPISFCSVSPDARHNPAAIWAHLDPVINLLKNSTSEIDPLHFFSDGPVTQYRQKENFFLFNKRLLHYGYRRGTWSFFEAGHGKGAADGIGGSIKRTADRLVTYGKDIMNAEQFFDLLRNDTTVKMFFITSEEINSVSQELPPDIPVLKGTLKVHQLFTELEGELKHRILSCFCSPQRGQCNCFQYINFSLKNDIVKSKVSRKSKGKSKRKRLPSISDSESEIFDFTGSNKGVYSEEEEDDMIVNAKKALYEDIPSYIDVTPDKIKKGVFLLIEFLGGLRIKSYYRYIGVTQEDLDDDGYVRVMFLKIYDDSGTIYKIDENDISDIEFNQIKKILPTPSLLQKGDRVLYKFPFAIDVLEK